MTYFTEDELRDVLQQKYADMPPMSEQFSQNLFVAWEQDCKRRRTVRVVSICSIAATTVAAASVALLLTLGKPGPSPQQEVESAGTGLLAYAVHEPSIVVSRPKQETAGKTVSAPGRMQKKKAAQPLPTKDYGEENPAEVQQVSPETSPPADPKPLSPIPSVALSLEANHTLSEKGLYMRRRMDEKFNEIASLITNVKEEKV